MAENNDNNSGDGDQELRMWVTPSRISRTAPFKVTICAGVSWLQRQGIEPQAIWTAGQKPCCVPYNKPTLSLGCTSRTPAPTIEGDELTFEFDYCRSHCNSSRLHLGGRVILMLQIRNRKGEVAAIVRSEPLVLAAKKCRGVARVQRAASLSSNFALGNVRPSAVPAMTSVPTVASSVPSSATVTSFASVNSESLEPSAPPAEDSDTPMEVPPEEQRQAEAEPEPEDQGRAERVRKLVEDIQRLERENMFKMWLLEVLIYAEAARIFQQFGVFM
eukprot:m51a1_g3134 hypothetical protein (274) ;mRNA; r:282293-283758